MKVGDRATFTKTFREEDVHQFSQISGDTNPIHLDDSYAKNTKFGRKIVHGMLTSSLISAVLGSQLPGPGSIYLKQSLEFLAPVFYGDTITAVVQIIQLIEKEDKHKIICSTKCFNQHNNCVIDGEAILLKYRDLTP